MARFSNNLSIRSRLLLATVGILVIGFGILTFVAGQQIAVAARADYEQQLINSVGLVTQGVRPYLDPPINFRNIDSELAAVIEEFEAQINGDIAFFPSNIERNFPLRSIPEVETALRNEIIVVQRDDRRGNARLFTAAAVRGEQRGGPALIVQLGVPLEGLQDLILRRWLTLAAVFAVVLLLASIAALLVARSIIMPLHDLRDSAVRLSQGDLDHRVQAIGTDEISKVAQAFNEMAAQVQSMLEEQRAFASNTSHELRTPLTTIRLRSEALRYDDSLDADSARQYISEIDDEIKRLGALVEDLTLLSRLDAGRAELGSSEIDMRRFAANLERQIAQQNHDVTLSVDMPGETLPIYAGLNHLTVVFRNLLDNAVKYTPPGGQINWLIRGDHNGITSTIQDTGQGIHPESLPHLFERFYRADKARSREVPGTGLGLALVKSILDAYGGSISISSPGPGRGTTVTVYWPRQAFSGA